MSRPRRRRGFGGFAVRCVCAVGVALALTLTPPALRIARSVVLLNTLTGGPPLAWGEPFRAEVEEQVESVQLPDGAVRARLYSPSGVGGAPGIVLLHGVHPRGIDEPRLRAFARALASGGVRVLTPELSELLRYRIDTTTIDEIRALTSAFARRIGRESAGVIGISFAGGLALMAAAEQTGRAPIAFVVTVGAHHDLLRLTRYYAGEPVTGPSGERADVAPHPYGARVMMREHLHRFFEPRDLPVARRALDTYLRDRHSEARRIAQQASAQGRATLETLLDAGASPELARLLSEAANRVRDQLERASPNDQLAGLDVPVFLVHGEADPVIPSIETRWLAREVPSASLRSVVITPLLRHAEFPQPPSFEETWELVRLVRDLLMAAGSAPRVG